MQDDVVIRVIAKVMIPAVMLFALYVQFHGDYGPGGGFQAGVIFAAAFVLNAMIFGLNRGRHVWPAGLNLLAICAGVLLYGLTGIASMLLGANYLDYDVLGATPQSGQHIGILLVEFGVGLTVASVMVALFFTFAGRLTHIRLMAKMQVHEEADQRKTKRKAKSTKKRTRK
ncbi:MAG: Na(+)/H(+) antiporter subunit B [Parvibaculales bacterium]